MPMSTHQSPAKPRSCLLYALLDPGYSWGEVRFSRLPRPCGQFGLLWCEVPQSARKGAQRLDARNGDSSGPGHGFVSHHFGGEVRSRGCWPSWASSCPLALVDVRLQGAQRAVANRPQTRVATCFEPLDPGCSWGEVRSRGCWPSWASSCPLALVDVRLQSAQRAAAIARKPAWLRALSGARSWLSLG